MCRKKAGVTDYGFRMLLSSDEDVKEEIRKYIEMKVNQSRHPHDRF